MEVEDSIVLEIKSTETLGNKFEMYGGGSLVHDEITAIDSGRAEVMFNGSPGIENMVANGNLNLVNA